MSNEPYIKSLEDLSQLNLEKIRSLILDIDDKLQLANNSEIMIGIKSNYYTEFLKNTFLDHQEFIGTREESLNYLKSQRIIIKYRPEYKQIEKPLGTYLGIDIIDRRNGHLIGFRILVDIQRFKDFKKEVEKIHKRKFTEDNSNSLEEFDLPEGARWEDIKIHFIDEHTVNILVQDKSYDKTYRELGFEDKRTRPRRPNILWDLLKLLAEKNGILTWEDSGATHKVKNKKFRLSKQLKEIFKIKNENTNNN